jgi:hypothetical protein
LKKLKKNFHRNFFIFKATFKSWKRTISTITITLIQEKLFSFQECKLNKKKITLSPLFQLIEPKKIKIVDPYLQHLSVFQ